LTYQASPADSTCKRILPDKRLAKVSAFTGKAKRQSKNTDKKEKDANFKSREKGMSLRN